MKTIVTFIAGAILASGLVFLMMSRHDAPPAVVTTAQQQQVAPSGSGPVTTPEATVVGSTPAEAPPPEPAATRPAGGFRTVPAGSRKPSAMPSASKNSKGSSQRDTPSSSPAPRETPQQTAQNTPPPSNPNGGPMIPSSDSNSRPSLPPPPAEDRRPEPPKRVPQTVTIPSGTVLTVRVDQSLSTARNKSGDSFAASLDQPLVVNGMVIAERGSKVEGRIVEADPGGRVSGLAQLQLELVRLSTSDGQRVRVSTEGFTKQAEKETKKDIAKVGAAAGIGAAIGAIAGGGKGAAIGAAVGGAAGTGGVMATRGSAAQLPAETRVTFHLKEAITITERIQ